MAGWKAILIAGPTASGKSGLALDLARRLGGTVVNADSLQVYEDLSILTARPTPADLSAAPHRLYGHVKPEEPYSAGRYRREVAALLPPLEAGGSLPILCGGTGLYFKALLGLLDAMPDVPDAIRESWRARLAAEGAPALHGVLAERDPASAARIDPADGQRIARALEVGEAAGRPMSALTTGTGESLLREDDCLKIVLTPERELLRRRIAARFDAMLDAGAMEEAAAFRARHGILPGSSARKAIGLSELCAAIDGAMSPAEARERSIVRSRQYAKRQETWFRHQFGAHWLRLDPADALDIALAAFAAGPSPNVEGETPRSQR
ncbi:tRNA (adenosine(37)-N6)-dimethylallyltransferase MiaA [Aurantimonas sp. Leaf443]|uniref:tRNA (adenosine(37)-N6)-dimethylallyltransferase MiaA n=1 Tax=Aurantimonas sp. Leaf443 TaxID=1736378 RepID=UPI000700C4D7|nr:tRNA (adenosine(37)-N6)-dimethylallyltransferase MiaA [Aurantimonas sp. Leaf443]KQT86083.1 tRNA dimethylallyltransferase [Aurantimonas sp. Leaf443]